MDFLFLKDVFPIPVSPPKRLGANIDLGIAIEPAENQVEIWVANVHTKMMFVSGETAEPSPETTTLIEEITRQQVIEIVST